MADKVPEKTWTPPPGYKLAYTEIVDSVGSSYSFYQNSNRYVFVSPDGARSPRLGSHDLLIVGGRPWFVRDQWCWPASTNHDGPIHPSLVEHHGTFRPFYSQAGGGDENTRIALIRAKPDVPLVYNIQDKVFRNPVSGEEYPTIRLDLAPNDIDNVDGEFMRRDYRITDIGYPEGRKAQLVGVQVSGKPHWRIDVFHANGNRIYGGTKYVSRSDAEAVLENRKYQQPIAAEVAKQSQEASDFGPAETLSDGTVIHNLDYLLRQAGITAEQLPTQQAVYNKVSLETKEKKAVTENTKNEPVSIPMTQTVVNQTPELTFLDKLKRGAVETGAVVVDGVAMAGGAAAAVGISELIVKFAREQAGESWPAVLDTPAGHALITMASPLIAHYFVSAFKEHIPFADFLQTGTEVAVKQIMTNTAVQLSTKMAPLFMELGKYGAAQAQQQFLASGAAHRGSLSDGDAALKARILELERELAAMKVAV